MIEIGGKPIIWHMYEVHGYNEFITLWLKGWMVREYFTNYINRVADVIVDLNNNDSSETFKVMLIESV